MNSTKKIERQLREEYPGSEISYTGRGHIKLKLPNGTTVFVSSSPSDEHFFWRNVRSDIKRRLAGR